MWTCPTFHSQALAADSQAGGSPLSCELRCLWVLSDLQVYPLWAHPATSVAGCRLYALVVWEDIAQVTLRGAPGGPFPHRRLDRFSSNMWILPTG